MPVLLFFFLFSSLNFFSRPVFFFLHFYCLNCIELPSRRTIQWQTEIDSAPTKWDFHWNEFFWIYTHTNILIIILIIDSLSWRYLCIASASSDAQPGERGGQNCVRIKSHLTEIRSISWHLAQNNMHSVCFVVYVDGVPAHLSHNMIWFTQRTHTHAHTHTVRCVPTKTLLLPASEKPI